VGSRNNCTKPRSSYPTHSTRSHPSDAKPTCLSWELCPSSARCARGKRTRSSQELPPSVAKRTCLELELRLSGTRCPSTRCTGPRCPGPRCSGAKLAHHHGNYPPQGQNLLPHLAIYPPTSQNILGLPANYALPGQAAAALPANTTFANPLAHAPPLNYYAQNATKVPDALSIHQMRPPDPSTDLCPLSLVRSNGPTPRALPGGGNYATPDPMPTG